MCSVLPPESEGQDAGRPVLCAIVTNAEACADMRSQKYRLRYR